MIMDGGLGQTGRSAIGRGRSGIGWNAISAMACPSSRSIAIGKYPPAVGSSYMSECRPNFQRYAARKRCARSFSARKATTVADRPCGQ
jgi:hypothetical protein